jgi:cold shock CspA family protein
MPMPVEKKMTGTVKFWDADRCFGFVIPDPVVRSCFVSHPQRL